MTERGPGGDDPAAANRDGVARRPEGASGPPGVAPLLTPDGRLIFVLRALRMLAYGLLSVLLGAYLAALGRTDIEIGAVVTTSVFGGAALTFVLGRFADRLGRRRTLTICGLAMILTGVTYLVTDHFVVLIAVAATGMVAVSGAEHTPFQAIEQAILPATVSVAERTRLFAWYNVLGTVAWAIGALATSLSAPLEAGLGSRAASLRALLLLYVVLAGVVTVLTQRLSPAIELEPAPAVVDATAARPVGATPARIYWLASLFWLDSFAGGFTIQSLLAYWFNLRFGLEPAIVGPIFFGNGLMSAVSYLLAVRMANRFGLINTMVWSHLPSNLFVALIPLAPTAPLAVILLFARSLLSQMDVPTRQAFTMSIVPADRRAATAGLMGMSRSLGQAFSPVLSGWAFATAALALPFFLSAGLKVVYDILLFVSFRDVKSVSEK